MTSPTADRRQGLVGNTPIKAPVTVAATSNITLAGQQTIDGVAVLAVNAAGVPDRVLVTAQTSSIDNGIYDVSTGAWTRSLDCNKTYDLAQGSMVSVTQGALKSGYYKVTTANPITIGTSALTWTRLLNAPDDLTAAALEAQHWADYTGGDVPGYVGHRSAKSWAEEDLTGATYGGSSKDWAQSASKPDAVNESAKTYAGQAGTSATAAAASAVTATIKAGEATAAAATAVSVTVAAANAVLYGGSEQVVGVGDSIMSGMTAPNTITFLTALAAYYKPLSLSTYTNDGVPGSRLDSTVTGGAAAGSDTVVRYAANVFPKRPAGSGSTRSLLIVDIGANDFGIMTDAQTTTWISRFETYCATARTDGFRVVAFTIMDRTGTASQTELSQNNRKRMNDAIRRSVNIDAFVDLAQLLTDPTNLTYFINDGTHPNDTGNTMGGRALASNIESIGKPIATSSYPAANNDPTVTPGMNAILDAAAIECVTAQILTLAVTVPAIGAADYTIEWWASVATGAASTNFAAFDKSGGSSFGAVQNAAGYAQIYNQPVLSANWSVARAHKDYWNHYAVRRVGTTATFFLNGVSIGTGVDASVHSDLTRTGFAAGWKMARSRVYSRALSDAEVLASYNNLSEYNAGEASYTFAMEDGCRATANFVEDLSSNGSHLILTDTTKVRIKRPARRGVYRKQTVGTVAVTNFPAGYRVLAYSMDVTISGGGNVNLGDTNGGGEYMPNTVLGVGKKFTSPTAPFTASGTLWVNAVGYTINHTILLEKM